MAWRRSRELILKYGYNATAYQILNPGINRWFSQHHPAVVGYVEAAGRRIVAGCPVGPRHAIAAVAAEFAAAGRRPVCYFDVGAEFAELLAARGPTGLMLLGAQPVWDPHGWPARLAGKSSLRAQIHRARNKQVQVQAWNSERATGNSQLQTCLNVWLGSHGLPTLHFLVEPQTLSALQDRLVLVAEQQGQVRGFLVASPIPLRHGWLIEQIVRSPQAPNGTVELLLDGAMRSMAAHGAHYVTLGLSPLSVRAHVSQPDQPLWLQATLAATRSFGRRFYNFEGLDAFKAKFRPDHWEPLYALGSRQAFSPADLYAIAAAFGGMPPALLISRTLWRTLRRHFAG
jgi:phosphatidylglycerol lysyltransferase